MTGRDGSMPEKEMNREYRMRKQMDPASPKKEKTENEEDSSDPLWFFFFLGLLLATLI